MYRLDKAKADVRQAQQRLAARIGQRDLLLQQRDEATVRSLEASQRLGNLDLVQILLQKTSDFARQQAKGRMEEIVTQALNVVFPGSTHSFTIRLDVKGAIPIAEYWLEEDGVRTQLKPPDYDRGGGKVDVVTLALRLAIAELEGIRGPILMDEVGKHVSAEYAPNVAYFLKQYSQQLGRQILLVTHNEHLAAIGDRSLRITKNSKGESRVTVL